MLAFFNAIQPMHVLLLLVVALLLFGNRLPDVARSIGRAFNEFKRGLRDVNDDLGKEEPPAEKPKLGPPNDASKSAPGAPTSVPRSPEPVSSSKSDEPAP